MSIVTETSRLDPRKTFEGSTCLKITSPTKARPPRTSTPSSRLSLSTSSTPSSPITSPPADDLAFSALNVTVRDLIQSHDAKGNPFVDKLGALLLPELLDAALCPDMPSARRRELLDVAAALVVDPRRGAKCAVELTKLLKSDGYAAPAAADAVAELAHLDDSSPRSSPDVHIAGLRVPGARRLDALHARREGRARRGRRGARVRVRG